MYCTIAARGASATRGAAAAAPNLSDCRRRVARCFFNIDTSVDKALNIREIGSAIHEWINRLAVNYNDIIRSVASECFIPRLAAFYYFLVTVM